MQHSATSTTAPRLGAANNHTLSVDAAALVSTVLAPATPSCEADGAGVAGGFDGGVMFAVTFEGGCSGGDRGGSAGG